MLNVEPTSCQGVHRVSLIDLANEIGVKPYQVPRILYAIQNNGNNEMTYDVDHKSFIVQVFQLPQAHDVTRLASVMLEATRRIESALI